MSLVANLLQSPTVKEFFLIGQHFSKLWTNIGVARFYGPWCIGAYLYRRSKLILLIKSKRWAWATSAEIKFEFWLLEQQHRGCVTLSALKFNRSLAHRRLLVFYTQRVTLAE